MSASDPHLRLAVNQTPNEDDPEIEFSSLSGTISRAGITVELQIYRMARSSEGWSLEVTDHDGGSTVWEDLFATDQDAYREFCETLASEGIKSFAAGPPTKH